MSRPLPLPPGMAFEAKAPRSRKTEQLDAGDVKVTIRVHPRVRQGLKRRCVEEGQTVAAFITGLLKREGIH